MTHPAATPIVGPTPVSSASDEDHPRVPHEPAALAPNTRLDGYVIGLPIGHGGMGVVYEATQDALGRKVAIKVMHPELAANDVMRARFLREAKATARLRHQHAVDVIDVGSASGVSYLVMERLEGESLARCLEREVKLSFERACALTLPVFAAVAAAHRAGIIHRDLKPQNVFLARTPEGLEWPKVLDFGVARLLDDESGSVTSTGAAVGTPFYMSPEQLLGSHDVGPRSDQFALAVVLYECLTGRRPFTAVSPAALCNAIVRGQYAHPRAVEPAIPARVDRALRRALRPDVGERFPDVAAFAREVLADAPDAVRLVWEPSFAADRPSLAPPATAANDEPVDPMAGTRPDHVATAALVSIIRGSSSRRRLRWWLVGAAALAAAALLSVVAVRAAARRTTPPAASAQLAAPVPTPVPEPAAEAEPPAPTPAVVEAPAPTPAPVAEAPRARPAARPRLRPPTAPARGSNNMPY